jgi:hypothetical protein
MGEVALPLAERAGAGKVIGLGLRLELGLTLAVESVLGLILTSKEVPCVDECPSSVGPVL